MHAGGPRILSDLSHYLGVDEHGFRHSRATLTEYGNIASAVVFDALRRFHHEGVAHEARELIVGFGPGMTAGCAVGTWSSRTSNESGTGASQQHELLTSAIQFEEKFP